MTLFARLIAMLRGSSAREEYASSPPLPEGRFACAAVRLPSGGLQDLPEWIRVVPVGDFPEHHDGGHAVTREHLDQMVANFSRQATELLFDFDHASVFGGSTRAAGWSADVEVRDDGLYVRLPQWTPAGQEAIASREYRYLSPVYVLESEDKQGQPVGAWLHSVSLTNDPYFKEGEIDAIGNSRRAAAPTDSDHVDPEILMDRSELIALLGLSDDASDDDIKARTDALRRAAEAEADSEEGDADADDAGDEPETPEEHQDRTLEAKVNSLMKRFTEREKAEASARVGQLVDGAIASGKIEPAHRKLYLNAAQHDFASTKADLDAIPDGAALPRGVRVQNGVGKSPSTGLARSVRKGTMDYVNETTGHKN